MRAGVSPATVDRALNGRRGVSPANRQRVLKAACDLGYLPSDGTVALPSRPARLRFLIPNVGNAFMAEVAESITYFARNQPLVAACEVLPLDGIGPDSLEKALDSLSDDTDGVGIITTDHPRSRAAITRLCEAGIRVVTIASDVPATPRSAYIGIDNLVAGRMAAQVLGLFIGPRTGAIAVFFGSRAFDGHDARRAGFAAYFKTHQQDRLILPPIATDEDGDRLYDEVKRLLRTTPDLAGVYCVGAGREGLVQALVQHDGSARPAVVMHDLTRNSRRWLAEGYIDALIDQNAQLIGQRAVLDLLGAIASGGTRLPARAIEPRIILSENIPDGPILS